MPDLEKLRTLALLSAILLISYSAAGVELESGAKASLFGIPFIITSPQLLPVGLCFLSIYAGARFFYYGVMLSDSPYRNRKTLLEQLHAEGGHGNYRGSAYVGPQAFSTTPLVPECSRVQEQLHQLTMAFPKVGKFRVSTTLQSHQFYDDDGTLRIAWGAEINIPSRCRIAALVQDIDYTAPVWTNFFALMLAGARLAQ